MYVPLSYVYFLCTARVCDCIDIYGSDHDRKNDQILLLLLFSLTCTVFYNRGDHERQKEFNLMNKPTLQRQTAVFSQIFSSLFHSKLMQVYWSWLDLSQTSVSSPLTLSITEDGHEKYENKPNSFAVPLAAPSASPTIPNRQVTSFSLYKGS